MNNSLFKAFSAIAILALIMMALPMQSAQAAPPTELFFSEYIEGSSNNKALEIYNGTGAAVNLATNAYSVQMFFNGSATAGLTINLTGTVADGDVYVVAQAAASAPILAQADQTQGSGWFNGDDAVVLRKGTTVIDVIGQIGFDPGTEWGTALTSTADNTLNRKSTVCAGDPNGSDVFDPSIEWDGFAIDTFGGLGAHTPNCVGDVAPSVFTTTPANGTAAFPLDGNISITFSEAVNVSGSWFTLSCEASGAHTATVSGGPTTFTLDVDTDFFRSENCTLTVLAPNVTDQDGSDPPDTMAEDFNFSFSTFELCGDPAALIHAVQGSGSTSPIEGNVVAIEGVVVGDYQGTDQFGGYHVQEDDADADGDPATSEGIFIFNTAFPVSASDKVRVRGTVTEFVSSGQPLTELASVSNVLVCNSGNSVTASTVTLPVSNLSDWERYEGMLINIAQDLTATENFTLGRFGEVALSVNGRLLNPTMVAAPGAPANALQNLNDRSRILLDDGNNLQNIDPTIHPTGGLSASSTLRSGYTVNGLTGVLEQRFGVYRVQPIGAVTFNPTNPRPAAPDDVGGRLKVSAMNVLNYFTTFDTNPGSGNGPNICGPTATLECRGANNAFEFSRQRDKIITAILGLDADIVGLMEIENNSTASVQDLVNGLNAASTPGNYDFIKTGTIGTDAIKVALIYRPSKVTPVGAHAILNSTVDPTFIDTLNRPVLAQTFEENLTNARFTVAVNHLKSKGSACAGDPDTGDGQGNCNLTRLAAAIAEANWLASDPTGSGDRDIIIIGDLNSYTMEDPISALVDAGYTNLIDMFAESQPYSFVFQGQSGYLDHALATGTITTQATGATEWHINADEPIVLDYNEDFKTPNHVITLYEDDAYRSSDHDPLIVGLNPLHYNFTGFFQPVDNAPTVNTAKAGQGIPLKFSLGGDQGLNIFAAGYPKIEFTACTSSTVDAVETTVSAGNSSLSYDAATDQYTYTWKTEKSWAGKCGTLSILFNDGTTQTALFKFTK